MAKRDIDVCVFGATSVTGRRVAAYLAERAPAAGLAWAAAGRDAGRVASILAEEDAEAPATLVADVGDASSLREMAARSRVVLNLVGPYTLHGQAVIAACVEQGAHYADLTGEIPFVRRIVDEFDAAAQDAGTKVVQVSGFEALPPDLAVARLAEFAREELGDELAQVDVKVTPTRLPAGIPRASDFVSGGTMQSLAEAVGDPDAACIADPACLIPDPERAELVRQVSPIGIAPRRDETGAAIAPMAPAAFINPAVIQRTAALGDPPASPFRYREGLAIHGGAASLPFRLTAASLLSATQLVARAVAGAPEGSRERAARLLRRALPASGFGPRPDRLHAWRWRLDAVARTAGEQRLSLCVEGAGHPGYLTTARILGEAGLMLAEPGATPERPGCVTPAIALGTNALERFDAAGLSFADPQAGS